MKRKYIEVETIFRTLSNDKLEDLGIKVDDESSQFTVVPAVIFLDKVEGLNPSDYENVTTVHMCGGSFLVKGNYEFIKALILEED